MADFTYDQFVAVAEKEWKLDFAGAPGKGHTITFPMTIGDVEWFQQMVSTDSGRFAKELVLSCTSVTARSVDQVHVEIHGYCRVGNAPNYGPGIKYLDENSYSNKPTPLRHVFKQGSDNTVNFTASVGEATTNAMGVLFVVRVLKNRALLPDFKSEAVNGIGRAESDVKLRVVDQIFHVNKEVLSAHSNVFDRMFNGKFKEASQGEIELEHEPADPALFEDFLLVLCVHNVLPNRKNLVGLFKLADYYEADNVLKKCERHFGMCREMPIEERFMLALELGNKELQDSIMTSVDLADAKRIIAVFVEKENAAAKAPAAAVEPTNKKRRSAGCAEPGAGGMKTRAASVTHSNKKATMNKD